MDRLDVSRCTDKKYKELGCLFFVLFNLRGG